MTQLSAIIQGSGKTAIDKKSYIATSGQTAFAVQYTAPFVEVYQNGVRLNAADYTATSGTTISLAVGAALNDEIELMGFLSDISTLALTTLTSQVSGILPVANGGTNLSASGTSGNVLTSNGTTWTSAALVLPASTPDFVIQSFNIN